MKKKGNTSLPASDIDMAKWRHQMHRDLDAAIDEACAWHTDFKSAGRSLATAWLAWRVGSSLAEEERNESFDDFNVIFSIAAAVIWKVQERDDKSLGGRPPA